MINSFSSYVDEIHIEVKEPYRKLRLNRKTMLFDDTTVANEIATTLFYFPWYVVKCTYPSDRKGAMNSWTCLLNNLKVTKNDKRRIGRPNP